MFRKLPTRRLLALPLVLVALASASTAAAHSPASASPAGVSVRATDQLEAQVLARINVVRRAHSLTRLRANPILATVAASHSIAMARNGFFAHASVDGAAFWKRVKARYGSSGFHSWSVGENLAWASPGMSAARAVDMWMNSPPHRANLLSPRWREIGLGGVRAAGARGVFGGLDVTILTADFGARS